MKANLTIKKVNSMISQNFRAPWFLAGVTILTATQSLLAHPGHDHGSSSQDNMNPMHYFTHPDHALWTAILVISTATLLVYLKRRGSKTTHH